MRKTHTTHHTVRAKAHKVKKIAVHHPVVKAHAAAKVKKVHAKKMHVAKARRRNIVIEG